MTTPKQSVANSRGRAIRKQQRRFWLLVGLGVVAFLVIASMALVGLQATNQQASNAGSALQLTDHQVPASAEPNGRAWGPKDAPITVVEYADYECESCGYFAKSYEQVFVETFANTGKVRFEVRNAPFHGEGALRAAQAAYCAAEQNMFWPFHHSLFLNQPAHGAAGFSVTMLNDLARQLALNTSAFTTCLSSGKYAAQVEADYKTAITNQVTGTPTFVVNGKAYLGPQSTADFRKIFAEVAPEVSFK